MHFIDQVHIQFGQEAFHVLLRTERISIELLHTLYITFYTYLFDDPHDGLLQLFLEKKIFSRMIHFEQKSFLSSFRCRKLTRRRRPLILLRRHIEIRK